MSRFTYTLPSGAEFIVDGPATATQREADQIFYEQVAAGSLVGYESGQTLISPEEKITRFELSRLERGTAGVETNPILAISQGLPTVSGVLLAQTVLEAIQNLPQPVSMPNLTNVELDSPIDEADIVLAKGDTLGPDTVGPLSSYEIQKLLAQTINLVDQESTEISQDKGIGQYGFTCYALEQAGYVKPGTSLKYFLNTPEDFVAVMSSPSVWTGKNGVYSLEDLLNDPEMQTFAQVELMQQGYESLLASGTITVTPQPSISVSSGQVYTNGKLQTVSALAFLGGTASLGSLQGIITNALSGSTSLSKLFSSQLTNLSTIGSGAITSALSSGVKSLGSLANLDFTKATSLLKGQLTGDIGALVTNASKFGTTATDLWAKSGGLSGITDKISGINLSNLNISSLDIYGKASQFATNFANPLSGLNNLGNLGNLGNLSSLNLGSIPGIGNLGSLSSLGSLTNIGSLGSVFGGGGDLVSGTQVAGGFNNTVNRKTVDAAFTRILGSSKIPTPVYEYPGATAAASRLDINQAQNILAGRTDSSNQVFGQTVTI